MHWLVGLLIGDYLLQTDYQAQNKVYQKGRGFETFCVACFHSLLVTISIVFCGWCVGFYWEPWKIVVIFWTHQLQDWTRFPTKLMQWRGQFEGIKGKKKFIYLNDEEQLQEHTAVMDAYIWATIVVDNVIHIATLFFLELM